MDNKPKEHDTINAVFVLWIAYKYNWMSGDKRIGSVSYFLRYINDKEYDGNVSEVNRCFKILSQRLSLDWLEQGNPMATAILYRNKNRGRTLPGIKNPEIFRIDFKDGFMEKQAQIFSQNMTSDKEKIGWISVCHALEEFSKTQKAQLVIN